MFKLLHQTGNCDYFLENYILLIVRVPESIILGAKYQHFIIDLNTYIINLDPMPTAEIATLELRDTKVLFSKLCRLK